MPFPHDSRETRRRRLLADRANQAYTPSSRSNRAGRPRYGRSKNYGDATFLDDQRRPTDLIPRRLSVIGLFFLLGLAGLVALEAGYAFLPKLTAAAGKVSIVALDLDQSGSLCSWYSSGLLLAAALVAVLVHQVRRHKKDDYQGYYRVWLWAALCWFILSVDEAASLHQGFKEIMGLLTGTYLPAAGGDGSFWWVIPYFFLLVPIGIRLALDMRTCRLSTACLLGTGLCFVAAVVVHLKVIPIDQARLAVMVEEGAEMLGDLLLLTAMVLHARFVLLDAEGRLAEKKKKPKKRKKRKKPAPVRETYDDMTDWGDDELYEDEYEAEVYDEIEYDEDELAAEEAILFGQNVRVHKPRRGVKAPTDAFSAGMRSAESKTENQLGRKLTKQEKKALRRKLKKQSRS